MAIAMHTVITLTFPRGTLGHIRDVTPAMELFLLSNISSRYR